MSNTDDGEAAATAVGGGGAAAELGPGGGGGEPTHGPPLVLDPTLVATHSYLGGLLLTTLSPGSMRLTQPCCCCRVIATRLCMQR